MAHPLSILTAAALAAGLAGCLSRTSLIETPPPAAPIPQATAPGPSIFIAAPGARVRSVIAARAQSRGTTVASNTAAGVVLERVLPQSTETLEAQCGPHRSGRIIRVILSTRDGPGGTALSEQRFIVDGPEICPVTLTPEEIAQANASLQDTRNQVLGVPPPQAAQPVAPAVPRT
jgi:hypothetical protein